MTTAEHTAPDLNAQRSSTLLSILGLSCLGGSGVALLCFVISSTFSLNELWPPAVMAFTASLVPVLFVGGLILYALAFPFLKRRPRRIAIIAAGLLLTLGWLHFQGLDAFLLFARAYNQALSLAEDRQCPSPYFEV